MRLTGSCNGVHPELVEDESQRSAKARFAGVARQGNFRGIAIDQSRPATDPSVSKALDAPKQVSSAGCAVNP